MLNLKILDIAKKTDVNRFYTGYFRMMKWDRNRITAYRDQQLQKLITYAFREVPYYRNMMEEKGLRPENIKCADDLKILPVLDRDIIQKNQDSLVSKEFTIEKLSKGSSSGTTGIPLHYYCDNNGLSAGIAAIYALWRMSGWKPGDRNVHIWGNANTIKRWNTLSSRLKSKLMHQQNIPSSWLDNPESLEQVYEQIVRYRPVSVEGYTSSIYTLAQYLIKSGKKVPGIKYVFTTAENLEEYQRNIIEKALGPTGDLYGCGEIMGVAMRPVNDEKFYILEPHVIVETMDSGLQGMMNILLTDLDNFGMPFIRYKLGDMIDNIYQPDPSASYPFPYFTKVMGRSSDTVTLPNGKRFHPVNIFGGTLFRKFPEITRHKVVWNGTSLQFIFEAQRLPDQEALSRQLDELLRPFSVQFTIEYTHKINPSSTGKYKYFEIKS